MIMQSEFHKQLGKVNAQSVNSSQTLNLTLDPTLTPQGQGQRSGSTVRGSDPLSIKVKSQGQRSGIKLPCDILLSGRDVGSIETWKV